MDKEMYHRLVVRLIYLARTKPNIAFVVSLVSQFTHQPKEAHLQVALRTIQYLKETHEEGFCLDETRV